MAKRPVEKYDFKAFGEAIKAARTGRKESRKQVSDEMYISPRYLANIENKGQHPSLQIFFELMSSKINLQTCEYACKSSIFQDNQLIYHIKMVKNKESDEIFRRRQKPPLLQGL